MPVQNPERILRLKDVLERTGLSRSTLYRKLYERTFPSQVRIAVRCVGWRESEVSDWTRNPEHFVAAPVPSSLKDLSSKGSDQSAKQLSASSAASRSRCP
jgi:prophage regulatory protein